MNWHPTEVRQYSLQCRATNVTERRKRPMHWNHGGYGRNVIQTLDVEVVA